MTRPLRQLHRRAFVVLTLVLPLAFVWGLAARRSIPPVSSGQERAGLKVLWNRIDLWPTLPLRTELLRGNDERLYLRLMAAEPLARPDVLVYWSPDPAALEISEESILLGAQEGLLPLGAARGRIGMLMLYSLADQEVLGRSLPFKLEPDTLN